jgi:hypothetical protein
MRTGPGSQTVPDTDVTRLLRELRLEAAVRLLKHAGSEVDSVAVEAMIQPAPWGRAKACS